MLAQPNRTIEGVAAELGIAASTLYRYVPGGRSAVLSGSAAERE
jgi:AcrR family transcriptional regulator